MPWENYVSLEHGKLRPFYHVSLLVITGAHGGKSGWIFPRY